jgi:hypothetical protein
MRRIFLAIFLTACGGGASQPAANPAPADAKAASKNADAGAADAAAPAERPFAGSVSDATQLISIAIDKKNDDVARCVREYRVRKKLEGKRVAVSMGIDQEGRLLGVTLPKGQTDLELSACIQSALKDALFPKSHAGVISVTRTYEEMVQ